MGRKEMRRTKIKELGAKLAKQISTHEDKMISEADEADELKVKQKSVVEQFEINRLGTQIDKIMNRKKIRRTEIQKLEAELAEQKRIHKVKIDLEGEEVKTLQKRIEVKKKSVIEQFNPEMKKYSLTTGNLKELFPELTGVELLH